MTHPTMENHAAVRRVGEESDGRDGYRSSGRAVGVGPAIVMSLHNSHLCFPEFIATFINVSLNTKLNEKEPQHAHQYGSTALLLNHPPCLKHVTINHC